MGTDRRTRGHWFRKRLSPHQQKGTVSAGGACVGNPTPSNSSTALWCGENRGRAIASCNSRLLDAFLSTDNEEGYW